MTGSRTLRSASIRKRIDELVKHYEQNLPIFQALLGVLQGMVAGSPELQAIAHSIKFRVKEPSHLRDKLERKAIDAQEAGKTFPYTTENLFRKINDLVGVRIIHLYTHQFATIHTLLLRMFGEYKMIQLESPKARTWDDESRAYFKSIGVGTTKSVTMYTSVHYVVKPNTRSNLSCEVQVRTLMEEVWGEVDHKINYPHTTPVLSCREQIKVLARVTSSCSRLVDSIFSTHAEAVTALQGSSRSTPSRRRTKARARSVRPAH